MKTLNTITNSGNASVSKTLSFLFAATLLILAGCRSQYYSGAYNDDDVYTPANQAYHQTNANNYTPANNNAGNNNYNDDYYNPNAVNSSTQYTDSATGNTYITNNYYGNNNQFVYDDYYDYAYAARIRRFRNPTYGFGYYNDFYTNYYFYNYDPWMYGNSIYAGYNWWGPSVTFSYGWGYRPFNYWGWNAGWGWGAPCYWDPWWGYTCNTWCGWGWNSWGWGSPYYNNYWWGYNNGYWNGYNQGYWNGYYNGLYSNYYYNTYDYNSNFYYGHRSVSQGGSGFSGKTSFGEQYLNAVNQGLVAGSKVNAATFAKERDNLDGFNIGKQTTNKVKDPVYNPGTKEIIRDNNTVGKEQPTTQGTKEIQKVPGPGTSQTGADRFSKENNTGNINTQSKEAAGGNVNTQSKELPKQDLYSRPDNTTQSKQDANTKQSADVYTRPQYNPQIQNNYTRPESSRMQPNQAQQARPDQYVAPQRTQPERYDYYQPDGNQNRRNQYYQKQDNQPYRNYDYNRYNQEQRSNQYHQTPQQKQPDNRSREIGPKQNERQNFNQNPNKGGNPDRGGFNQGGWFNRGSGSPDGNFNSGGSNRSGNTGGGRSPR